MIRFLLLRNFKSTHFVEKNTLFIQICCSMRQKHLRKRRCTADLSHSRMLQLQLQKPGLVVTLPKNLDNEGGPQGNMLAC